MSESAHFIDPMNVDICVTCVADKPPTLPLREELLSLGVEVVLNAHGIGQRTSRHESKRAVKDFRRNETVKDLKKRRFFRKSSRRIRQQLEERKRIEQDLTLLHAISYEAYEHEHEHGFDDESTVSSSVPTLTTSESSGAHFSSYSKGTGASMRRHRHLWGRWSQIKKSLSVEKRGLQKTQTQESQQTPLSIVDLVGDDNAFVDLLAPVNHHHVVEQSDEGPMESASASAAAYSHEPSSLSSRTGLDREQRQPGLEKVQFVVSSAAAAKDLPDLRRRTIKTKAPHVDSNVQNAFANVDLLSKNPAVDKNKNGKGKISGQQKVWEPPNHAFSEQKQLPANNQQTEKLQASIKLPTTEEKNERGLPNWIGNAFSHLAADFYKVTGLEKKEKAAAPKDEQIETSPFPSDEASSNKDQSVEAPTPTTSLFDALENQQSSVEKIRTMLLVHSAEAAEKRESDGRTPLHALCDRGMPAVGSSSPPDDDPLLANTLMNDITQLQELLSIVLESNPTACVVADRQGDLPVHLLARRLLVWEASWYETIYQQAQKERDLKGKMTIIITKLYHAMSQCIQRVLAPIVSQSSEVCQMPGNVGTLLPLHIATIFTAPVPTLRALLETYPQAATERCHLGGLHTFVPPDLLPLELHDSLSTDFPKVSWSP